MKTTKDQLINHYHIWDTVTSLCHITDSVYLVGFLNFKLIVWNEKTAYKLFKISNESIFSMRRVMNSSHYIVKTADEGLKLLTINDMESKLFSLQNLLEADEFIYLNDNLQLQITHSHIVIATTHIKNSIKVMNVPIAEISEC
jgi:hypothetical protein